MRPFLSIKWRLALRSSLQTPPAGKPPKTSNRHREKAAERRGGGGGEISKREEGRLSQISSLRFLSRTPVSGLQNKTTIKAWKTGGTVFLLRAKKTKGREEQRDEDRKRQQKQKWNRLLLEFSSDLLDCSAAHKRQGVKFHQIFLFLPSSEDVSYNSTLGPLKSKRKKCVKWKSYEFKNGNFANLKRGNLQV